ncbi:MAG TPA: hypothetical protein VGT24_11990 [Candidatus Acidoferrales bacterium]|nr:hypothetical protein [Candidatus Acidoferrales bacterium]
MLTLFAIPKHFRGQIAAIQKNAITSWTHLSPKPEILLFGNEEGTAKIAAELGLRHFPDVARNEFGTPLVDDLFRKASQTTEAPVLGYVNADIILTNDFCAAVDRVRTRFEKFMMVGQRWDLDREQPLDFSQARWADAIREQALRANVQRPGNLIDYFVYTRGLCDALLPLAIGRFSWDNYLLWLARSQGAELVDVSPAVVAIHQNHDYSHHPKGPNEVREGPERKRNREMVGDWWHLYTIEDATRILDAGEFRRSHRHGWLMAKRLWSHPLTIAQLPWLAVKRLMRG